MGGQIDSNPTQEHQTLDASIPDSTGSTLHQVMIQQATQQQDQQDTIQTPVPSATMTNIAPPVQVVLPIHHPQASTSDIPNVTPPQEIPPNQINRESVQVIHRFLIPIDLIQRLIEHTHHFSLTLEDQHYVSAFSVDFTGYTEIQTPTSPKMPEEFQVNDVTSTTGSNCSALEWDIGEVVKFIETIPGCAMYAREFSLHAIDGKALFLMTPEHLVRFMDINCGHALKIIASVDELRQALPKKN